MQITNIRTRRDANQLHHPLPDQTGVPGGKLSDVEKKNKWFTLCLVQGHEKQNTKRHKIPQPALANINQRTDTCEERTGERRGRFKPCDKVRLRRVSQRSVARLYVFFRSAANVGQGLPVRAIFKPLMFTEFIRVVV